MQISTSVRRFILIFLRYACELSFTFGDFDTVAFLIISAVVIYHVLTLISYAVMHGHVTVHCCTVDHRHVHHSVMMNVT